MVTNSIRERMEGIMALVQINRDPFARASLMRDKCEPNRKCAWCGNVAKWRYGWVDDSGRNGFYLSLPFCSVGCWRDYHG